jgi:imidazolonepropionase
MLLIKNIKELVQIEEKPVPYRAGDKMQEMHTLKVAWLLIEKDKINISG